MRSSLSIDETFQSWTWEMLLRLKLHRSQLNCDGNTEFRDKPTPLMDANEGTLLPRANSENLPQGCFVTIVMTNVGHSMNVFLQQGLSLLKNLAVSGHKTAAVQCLALVVPMFIQGGIDLSINHSFTNILHSCIMTDVSVLSGIAQKLIELSPKVPHHMELLMGAIGDLTSQNNSTTILTYWIKMVLSTEGWWDDDNSKTLLDFLFKIGFYDSPECSFECGSILYERHYELMTHSQKNSSTTSPTRQNRSVISSILNAVSGGNSNGAPTFLRELTSNYIYLAYYLITAESRFEDDCKLWTTMLPLMKSNSTEASLKKAASQLKLHRTPLLYQLSVFRLAKLAVLTDSNHPLLPAICQKFFLRFIHMDPYVGASMGPKFFKGQSEAVLYKQFESKLSSLCNGNSVDDDFEIRLQKLYRTFSIWLEEEKLHDGNLYLPSLPLHYEPALLAKVRTQNQTIWSQYINYDIIIDEIKTMNKRWVDFHTHNFKPFPAHSSSLSIHATSCQRVTQLLRQFESPLNLDPSHYASIDFPILVDQLISSSPESLVGDIEHDLKGVLTHAQSFTESKTKLENFNRNYLELLPDLYTNEEQRKLLKIECQSAFSPTHRCAGPAQVQIRYLEKILNDIASENLKKNRASYREVVATLTDSRTSEDFSYSAVHLITIVQALIKKTQRTAPDENKSLFQCGAKLFYELADLNSDERWKCPPTRHLLVTCIDMLGQVFIYGQPDQAVPLLEQMLKRPETAALLSAHFSPAKSCKVIGGSALHNEFDTSVFVEMYKRVVAAATKEKSSDVLFVLITKFDLESWCVDYSPPKIDHTSLLEAIINGLVSHTTFSWPQSQASEETALTRSQSTHLSNSAVQEVFMTHLSILLQHSMSLVFFETINLLLKVSSEGTIDPTAWETLNQTTFESLQAGNQDSGNVRSVLSYECVVKCIKLLAVYFADARRALNTGLYTTWKPYVYQISKLFYNLAFFEINYSERLQKVNGATHFMHHSSLVERIFPLFSAWLEPFTTDGEKLQWPWELEDQDVVSSILTVFTSLLNLICREDTVDVSQCVASLWGFYLNNSLLAHEKVTPSYICGSYQTTLSSLPWNKFIPNLTDLDRMVQLCNSKLECSLHFLCHIVPEIDWSAIMRMCNISNPENGDQQYAEHTSEVLSYLLQVLFILGSDEKRMNSYVKLQHLLTSIDDYPWHLIAYDQFDFLSNIIADRYIAYCTIFDCEDKNLQSPRYAALRLLQIASGLPVLEKEFDWQKMLNKANSCDDIWMKRQSYIRCVGTLVRKSVKTQDKRENQLLEAVTSNIVMKTMRSILFIIQSDTSIDETNLSSLYSEIWRSMNAFPQKLQEITRTQILNFVNEVVLSSVDFPSENTQIVDLILTSVLASASSTITVPSHLSFVAEYMLDSCLRLLAKYESKEEIEKLYDILDDNMPKELTLWKTLCHTLGQICKVSHSELVDGCLSNNCVVTILALAQNMIEDAKVCGSEVNGPMYNACFTLVQWVISFAPKIDNESKLLLLFGYVLKVCKNLEDDAKLRPEAEMCLNSVGESISTLLPVLEQWRMDKVKSGILGSLGIGRATSISVGFRVSIRCLSVHFQQIIARLQPDGDDLLTKAQQAIDTMRKLSLDNRVYSYESDKIHELLDLIQEASDKHVPSSHLPIMTKIFSFYFQTEAHFLTIL